jgi:hypothetical protein
MAFAYLVAGGLLAAALVCLFVLFRLLRPPEE